MLSWFSQKHNKSWEKYLASPGTWLILESSLWVTSDVNGDDEGS